MALGVAVVGPCSGMWGELGACRRQALFSEQRGCSPSPGSTSAAHPRPSFRCLCTSSSHGAQSWWARNALGKAQRHLGWWRRHQEGPEATGNQAGRTEPPVGRAPRGHKGMLSSPRGKRAWLQHPGSTLTLLHSWASRGRAGRTCSQTVLPQQAPSRMTACPCPFPALHSRVTVRQSQGCLRSCPRGAAAASPSPAPV